MKLIMSSLSSLITGVPDQVRKLKWLVLLAFVLTTAAMFFAMQKIKFDFTIDGWFDKDDPTFVAYNEFNAQFGSQDGVLIVYRPKDNDVFSAKSLELVRNIRNELLSGWAGSKDKSKTPLSHIVEVKSLVNAPVLSAQGDILLSHPLVGQTVPQSREALEEIRQTAKSQPGFELQYFSKNMQYGGIYIKTDFGAVPWGTDDEVLANPDEDLVMESMEYTEDTNRSAKETPRFKPTDVAEYYALNEAIKAILEKPEYANHFEYYKVGNTVDSENQLRIGEEMGVLYLLALSIMILLLWFLFRSLSGVVWSLLIIVLTTIWTIGISAAVGLSATPLTICTVLLIMTIGMADAVHIISGYLYFRNEGHSHASALTAAYDKAGMACLLTSVTTMVGLLSLSFSHMVPIRSFSIMSTTGVGAAFIITLFLLPLLLDLWSPVPKNRKTGGRRLFSLPGRVIPNFTPFLQKQLDKIVPAVEKRPVAYIVPFVLVFIVCLYGATNVKADYNLTDAYGEGAPYRKSIALIDDKMAGSGRISVYFDLKEKNALHDPEVLKVIETLQEKFESEYSKYVVTTSSIVDIVKDANQKLHGGRQEMYTIPPTKQELSQTLFLFNIADPDERATLVDEGYRKANLLITIRNFGSYEYNDVFVAMKEDINSAMRLIRKDYPDANASVTGFFAMGMRVAEYVIVTQLESYGIAILVISTILLVVFNSFKAGVVSLIPNLIPSFLALGLLGLLNIHLDFYTMMLAPIVIGVSVDDTIHFITQYRKEVLVDGDMSRALKQTVKECGQAIVFTSLILGLGFGAMAVASTPGYANLGKFGFLCIFAGLLNDLFLTPALIKVFKVRFGYSENANTSQTANLVNV